MPPITRQASRVGLALVAGAAALGTAGIAAPLHGQMLGGSARAAGMADAYGAVARGATAVFYNPANLGLPGNPRFGFQLPQVTVTYGAAPITLRDIDRYGGQVVPQSVKEEWLARIPANGTLRGNVVTDVSAIGLSVGPLALAVGAVGEASVALPRSAVEVFLFGNGGVAGTPQDFTLTNGGGHGFAVGFAAAGLGLPIARWGAPAAPSALAFGVTGKYLAAGAMAQMWDAGGTITGDPITAELRFPAFTVWHDDRKFESKGWGADVGIAVSTPRLDLGLTVTDVVNTFEWDRASVRVRDGRAFISEDSATGHFDEQLLDSATLPEELRDTTEARLADAVFKPAVRASAAYRTSAGLLLTADFVRRTGSARSLQSALRTSASVGAEWRLISFLPLRAGATAFTGGTGWSVGSGLEFGVFNLNVAYGRRTGDYDDHRLSAGITFGRGR